MTITYIDHSCFLVELKQHYLLFDYAQGEIPKLDSEKVLLVFASHRHGDHFSHMIFDLAKDYPTVQYIISDDIWQNRVPDELYGKTVFVGPGEEEEVAGALIRTYRSTDEGVAFVVTVEGETLYHAGDLNHWHWNGEPEEWNRKMGENYIKELEKMAEERIRVAFLPLDTRLEENFRLGADEFMNMVGAEVVFPMHFWGDYSAAARLKAGAEADSYRDKVREIQKSGQQFTVI